MLPQDFCRDRDQSLPSLSLKAFAAMIFKHCPGLAHLQNDKHLIFAQFSAYKQAVPVMGAIMLNAAMDKCLLVRGYKEGSAWGFPRGKISKDETDAECAIREVCFLDQPHLHSYLGCPGAASEAKFMYATLQQLCMKVRPRP